MIAISRDEHEFLVYDGKKTTRKKTVPKSEIYLSDCFLPVNYAEVTVLKCGTSPLAVFMENQEITDTPQGIWKYHEATPAAFYKIKPEPALGSLYSTFKDIQRARISAENRLRNLPTDVSASFMKQMQQAEKEMFNRIKDEVEKYPIYQEWLVKIPGIASTLAAGVLAIIGPGERYKSRSAMYNYCGYGLVKNEEGVSEIQKDKKGSSSKWNHKAKSLMYNVCQSMIKCKSPVYYDNYVRYKEKQLEKGLKKAHANLRAIRFMSKLFLSHYWEVSLCLAGREDEVTPPYAIAHLEHQDLIEPPYWLTKKTKEKHELV